jgi:hypothetical protein
MKNKFTFTIYINVAVAYIQQGFFTEAKKVLKLANQLNDKSTIVYFRLAQCLAYNLVIILYFIGLGREIYFRITGVRSWKKLISIFAKRFTSNKERKYFKQTLIS